MTATEAAMAQVFNGNIERVFPTDGVELSNLDIILSNISSGTSRLSNSSRWSLIYFLSESFIVVFWV